MKSSALHNASDCATDEERYIVSYRNESGLRLAVFAI